MIFNTTLYLSLFLSTPSPTPLAQGLPVQVEPVVSNDLPRRGTLGLGFSPVPEATAIANGLKPGVGILALKPLAGSTAEKAGIKESDIILSINGTPVTIPTIGSIVREIRGNDRFKAVIIREGKEQELWGQMIEKPRDPGNKNFEVIYSQIISNGNRMRTIITKPRTKGKFPAFFFIQGFSPISYDFTLATATGDVKSLDGPLLFDFANAGFVTIRVEKPGVGDSEGGPFAPMDYTTELDIYRQTLKQLKSMNEVDTSNVFIFGHSMGGAFGPMVAAESPVKGMAMYGVATRTWFEYLVDTIRYQGLVAGASFQDADELTRQATRMMALIFLENKSPAEVKVSHPQLAGLVDEFFPGGLFNGKSLDFWRQLGQTNFADYWAKTDSYVLSVRGQSDFVTYDLDHKLIADIVNQKHPGRGTFAIAPSSDHLFHNFPTEQDSLKNFQKGTYNPGFSKMMMKWMLEVIKKPPIETK